MVHTSPCERVSVSLDGIGLHDCRHVEEFQSSGVQHFNSIQAVDLNRWADKTLVVRFPLSGAVQFHAALEVWQCFLRFSGKEGALGTLPPRLGRKGEIIMRCLSSFLWFLA